jgi:tetratricopeptide (TPR) repeat protein
MRVFMPRMCVFLAFLAGSCATTSADVKGNLRAGEEAFQRGDVLEAYRLLRNPALTRETLPLRYSTLLRQVTEAAEYLIERWLEKGDFWLAQGNFSKALSYYQDIADQLPETDPFRMKLMEKARELEVRIEDVRKEVEALVEKGLEDFKASKFEQARQKLVEARWKAVEHSLSFTMRYQRIIEECKRQLPEELEDSGDMQDDEIAPDEKKEEKLTRKSRRRHVLRKRKGPDKPDEEEVYRSLLRQGHRYHARKMYLEAILTFRKVLEMYPEQTEASKALEKLEPIRKQLLDEEMRKAGEYFAKENLEEAVPHYQRVLLLDPGNIRAKEGLQMYHRLRELKDRQR